MEEIIVRYFLEKYWTILGAVIGTMLFTKYRTAFANIDGLLSKLLESSLSVCSTLLGFFLTIITIISSINTRRMHFIRTSGHYANLQSYLNNAIILNLITVLVALFFPFVLSALKNPFAIKILQSMQVLVIIWTWLSSIRFVQIFIRLIKEPTI